MNGQTAGLAIVGSLFLLCVFVTYVATTIVAIATSLLILLMVQGKFPIIARGNLPSIIGYAFLWSAVGTAVMFYTCVLLVPASQGLDGLQDIAGALSELELSHLIAKTALELFVISLATGVLPEAFSGRVKAIRFTAVILCLGLIEGFYAFQFSELISVFFSAPTTIVEAFAQGALSGFLIPIELASVLSIDDNKILSFISRKYAVNPFNPYTYMNLVSIMVWCWAVYSFLFSVQPNLTKFVEQFGADGGEKEFLEGIPIFLMVFAACHFVIFYTMYMFNRGPGDDGLIVTLFTLLCFIAFVPAVVILFFQIITAPFFLLGASSIPSRSLVQGPEATTYSKTEAKRPLGEATARTGSQSTPPIDSDIEYANSNSAGINVTATSRNAPCPCGSGKRLKYCHGKL